MKKEFFDSVSSEQVFDTKNAQVSDTCLVKKHNFAKMIENPVQHEEGIF
jgi:hypothetical protein